jgi:hypothetical protein
MCHPLLLRHHHCRVDALYIYIYLHTVVTLKAEAADITAKGTNHGVLAH